ncbi:hypothetical protein [Sphingomonas sp. Ag1]|uniref:hypothetical protein n=1 Tax=Sphingomonas sp. Ag1 TaxID=1642949 RepID=UPI000623830E|nr:hypothetical protein [Sphingomonas sp. Ag1]
MMPPQRPFDLAQPFDVHPLGCDCSSCHDATAEPSLAKSVAVSFILAAGGLITGQVIGVALNGSGILALLGIG